MSARFPARFFTPLFFSILGALVALFLFERLADEMLEGDTLQFDSAIRGAVHNFASPGLTTLMRFFSAVGNIGPVLGLTLLACIALLLRHRRAGAVLIAITIFGAGVLMWGLKIAFHRARPSPYFGLATPADFSFPSGHALVAFCFYGVMAAMVSTEVKTRLARVATWAVAALMAFGIGLSRIYLGVHYPSDVLGGYLAAAVWVTGNALVYRRFHRRDAGGLPQ